MSAGVWTGQGRTAGERGLSPGVQAGAAVRLVCASAFGERALPL